MSLATLPEYVTIDEQERGDGLGISWDDYRALARTALRIIENVPAEMAIYRLPNSQGAVLDIWSDQHSLSLQIDSVQKQLSLFRAEMDSAGCVTCLLTVSNSEDDWRKLGRIARREILKA